MKRGILAAILVLTAAGFAGASLLTTVPSSPRPQPPTEAPPIVAKARAEIGPAPAPSSSSIPAPTLRSVSPEVRQAPVPLLAKPRPVLNPPAAEAPTAEATAATAADPAASNDALGESAARAAIEADGYKGVKVLRKGANGVWHATALRGTTKVMLTVDAGGSVSAD